MTDNSNKKISKNLTQMAPVPIQMIDHADDTDEDVPRSWCKDVMIGEYTIVNGSNNARFVVWTITIETSQSTRIVIRKRYNDFVSLRSYLLQQYPTKTIEIPKLPTKSILLNFEPNFLEHRRNGLEFFISSILLNPSFCNDTEVKRFIME